MDTLWPWFVLIGLGAYHGLNPGMGWLFAVARGLQERSRAVVIRSFAPIAFGHMLSVAVVVALVALAQPFVAADTLRLIGALVLIGFGIFKLVVRAHPRWVGMRVGARELVLWSFLMATAHGAGLMLVPVVLHLPANTAHVEHLSTVAQAAEAHDHAAHDHAAHTAGAAGFMGLLAVGVHTIAMFAVMAGVAVLVYMKLGLAVLRRAWFNLDLLWAWSLIGAGVVSLSPLWR